jgi:hypothetical protein
MPDELPSLQKRLLEAEDELSLYKKNGAVGLYYELNRFVNGTVSLMRTQSLAGLITGDDKDPKKFERMMALIKNAKEHIIDMEEIKTKLRLTGNEEKDKSNVPFIETIAEPRK